MLIKLKDYERIHRIISSVARHEGSDPAHSCIFFSVFGAHVLKQHFGVEPRVRCGLAVYHVGGNDDVLCFGELTEEGVTGALQNFHCWVEVDGWAIDFMAPAFPALVNSTTPVPSKMFQKRQSDMAPNLNELRRPGDFFLSPADHLTMDRLKHFLEAPVYGDLATICAQWFVKYPKKIRPQVGMMDNKGQVAAIGLSGPVVRGRW